MNNKAYLKYENIDDLREVVNWLNERYKLGSRTFSLIEKIEGKHEVTVTDKSDLIPYGIFEIGSYIGQKWMRNNYRLELGEWQESINQLLFKDVYYPKYEKVKLSFKNSLIEEFEVRNALGITSSLDTIKPFLSEQNYFRIAQFCEFKKVEYVNSHVYTSNDGLKLNYHIINDQLLIFGTKADYTNKDYEVRLISAFEIKIPKHDI